MIRVLGLALYGSQAASTRYRLAQYQAGLAGFGIDLQIDSLLSNHYLRERFAGKGLPLADIAKSVVCRLATLWRQSRFDAVMLHCEMMPLLPALFERAMIRLPFIYDFDDAFYLKYRLNRSSVTSRLLGAKFDKMIAEAAAVTAGSRVLSDFASRLNSRTTQLPTVVDTERYVVKSGSRSDSIFTLGWIGSPSTAPYLREIVAPLAQFGLEQRVRLVVIGAKAPQIASVEVVEIPWAEATEVELINSFDVGVMPLPDEPWARGKCAFKLIQYMACGVPVIASPVGANLEVVTSDTGLLAATDAQWLQAFRVMLANSAARREMGAAARQRIVANYALHSQLPRLARVIQGVAGAA